MPDSPAPTISTSKCSTAALPMGRSEAPASHGFVRSITPLLLTRRQDKDGRDEPGHLDIHEITLAFGRPRLSASVAIMIALERAFLLDADVIGLVLAQFGELNADLGEMQPRHLLI